MIKIQKIVITKPLLLLFSNLLGLLLVIQAQEPDKQEKKSAAEKPTQSQKPGETAAPKNNQDEEEYIEFVTPFGRQRFPKTPGVGPSQQAVPSTAPTQPSGPTTPNTPGTPPTPVTTSRPQETARTPPSVRLTLDHVDLQQVINIIGNELKINYVVDPKVKGIVTINTAGEFRRADLLPLLESILKFNGAAIVKTGNFYQIVPATAVKQLSLPVRVPGQAGDLGSEAATVMQIVPMRFVPAADMAKILTPYLSESGNIVAHEGGNILIITETSDNLKRLLELVNIFDADVFQNKRVQLYLIKNNRSKNLLPDLESVFAGYGLSSNKESAVKFISIDRINSILAICSDPSSFAEVEKWIGKLDQAAENAGVRNYYYKIENAEAKNIATLLLQIYGQQAPSRASEDEKSSSAPSAPFPNAAPSSTEKAKTQTEKLPGVPAGTVQGEINIVADEINNALIIRCSPQDYEIIKETIQELDRVPRQVLIDAKVYEVNLTGALSMGVSAFLQQRSNQSRITQGSFSVSPPAGSNLLPGLNISTGTLIGNTRELIAFLNAQESRSRTRVLSSPSIIASDNNDARIQVGSEVPILTSQGVVPGGQIGGTSLFSNTIQNRPTGVILSVTPRISSSGWVTLKIQQEVSTPVAPQAGSGIQSPSISIRSVRTQVTLKDGETIAIGGIISENKLLSKNRVPLLGDIPGVGLLFGNTSYTNARTELIALITPHVIQDVESAIDASDELKSQLKSLKKDLKRLERSSK